MSSTKDVKFPNIPPGLRTLIDQCQAIYPDQTNPLQVTTVLKYWLGGQDPLDYISMYSNKGDPDRGIPSHWHYVSFGLSDLHGDGRVHIAENSNKSDPESGMGFELTFRLIKSPSNGNQPDKPPTWPANLLQALARYCFQTGNRLFAGDNIPWKRPLDGCNGKIQHLLIADDAQLARTRTPFGWVDFCQIVGVTDEELEQASRWNGKGVLNMLKREHDTGGDWLVTDVRRTQSVFELFPETLQQLEDDLEKEGSDLAGINAEFTFKEIGKTTIKTEPDAEPVSEKSDDMKGETINFSTSKSLCSSLNKSYPVGCQPSNVIPLDGVELTFAPYAAKFLLLAVKDRIRHGRHFTFKSRNLALTFVGETVTGTAVSKEYPYGVIGYWIQVLLPDDLVPRLMAEFSRLKCSLDDEEDSKREVFDFPEKNLRIIIEKPENIHGIMKAVAL